MTFGEIAVFAGVGQAEAVADTVDVGIHGECVYAKCLGLDDLGGFGADAREGDEFFEVTGDFAVRKGTCAANYCICFTVEVAAGSGYFAELVFTKFEDSFSCFGQEGRDCVYSFVGTLCGEDYSDE